MRKIEIAPAAAREFDRIVVLSRSRFGPAAARRYRRLFNAAVRALRLDPGRTGVRAIEGDAQNRKLFHLRHARAQSSAEERVANPRHLILFRATDTHIVVLRVLHDSMDLDAQVDASDDE